MHENPARVLGAGATPAPSSASRGQIGALKALSLVQRGQCTYEEGTYRHCQRWWGPLRSPLPFRPCQRERPEGKPPSTGPQRLRRHLLPAKTAHYYASTSRLPPPQIPLENKHPLLLQASNTTPAIPSPPSLYPPRPLFPFHRLRGQQILRVFSIPLRERRLLHTPLSHSTGLLAATA